MSTTAVHSHPAEEWLRARRGGWQNGAGSCRESPDGGEEPAGGAAEGDDSKSARSSSWRHDVSTYILLFCSALLFINWWAIWETLDGQATWSRWTLPLIRWPPADWIHLSRETQVECLTAILSCATCIILYWHMLLTPYAGCCLFCLKMHRNSLILLEETCGILYILCKWKIRIL